VDCVKDVIEELAPQLGTVSTSRADSQAEVEGGADAAPAEGTAGPSELEVILSQLKGPDKLHVDSIIEGSGLNVQTVLKLLLKLELNGRVAQHPGKLFSLI
jgi:predicted Rossmann fold nucleotide-binding protein DprA/Smf involved in DNA uptake